MNILSWLQSSFSVRHKALKNYQRGMARAKRRDHEGALANYTAAIDLTNVPDDVKAMALYNRALVYVAAGDDSKGVDDLDSVLAMDGEMMIVNVKTMARQKLDKMKSRNSKSNT
jgi:hypothetical protein